MRILIIEEDDKLGKEIEQGILEDGYRIDIANSVKDAEYYVDVRNYDLVILDFDIENSTKLIATIKHKKMRTSILVISSQTDVKYEIEALRSGAEDYVGKPLDLEVLNARVIARLRFGGTSVMEFGEFVIDPDEEKIIYKSKHVELKGKPFEVLTHLAKHGDRIVSKEQLLDAIWEEPELVTPNVIEVAINQIRQKLDKPLGIATIETVRRRGYRFCYQDVDGEEI